MHVTSQALPEGREGHCSCVNIQNRVCADKANSCECIRTASNQSRAPSAPFRRRCARPSRCTPNYYVFTLASRSCLPGESPSTTHRRSPRTMRAVDLSGFGLSSLIVVRRLPRKTVA